MLRAPEVFRGPRDLQEQQALRAPRGRKDLKARQAQPELRAG